MTMLPPSAKPKAASSAAGSPAATDPLAAARQRLFPPLRNRNLAEAAEALSEGRIAVAEPLVARVLDRKPHDPDALNLLAGIRRHGRNFEEAEALLARCVGLAPDHAGYRYNHASVLRRRDKFAEAIAELDRVLEGDPGNAAARDLKATILPFQGRHAEAVSLRQALVNDFPGWPEGWLQYGQTLRRIGRSEDCISAYRHALALQPATPAAYAQLSDLKTYQFTAAEIAGMQKLLGAPSTTAADRARLHFALGKAYGDCREYGKSFENYARANAFERAQGAFDAERLTQYRNTCEAVFTRDFVRERERWGFASQAPIFIVGMPRSGSTLVEQILSSHSAVEGLGELAEFDSLTGELFSRMDGRPAHEFWIGGWFEFRGALAEALPHVLPRLEQKDVRALGEDYVRRAEARKTTARPRFCDKGLRNFGHAGLIALALPDAVIVDVRRHPLDCGWSSFKSHFPGRQPFAEKLSEIGRHTRNYVALMAHFDRVLPGRIHRILYDHLVADPEGQIRRLLDAAGLPFEAQCLRFHENRRAVATISSEQVRTPLYQSGVAQWRPYEPWLAPLKAALGAVLDSWPEAPE